MSSSNPILKSLSEVRTTNYYGGYQQQAQDPYGQYAAPIQSERPMTVDDVVTNTGITLGVIILTAAVNFGIAAAGMTSITLLLTLVGALGGLVAVLISTSGRKYGSKVLTLVYAVFEGLFVGGISVFLSGFNVSKQDAGMLIGQAVIGTLGVFLGMLYVYKTGAVKVTPRFQRIMTSALIGVMVLMLANFIGAMFFNFNPLRDGGPIAIIFSLVCIVLAALSFLQDFDMAERMVREGVPARYSWGVAMGLAVTLVWLYTEILRLLSYFQSR